MKSFAFLSHASALCLALPRLCTSFQTTPPFGVRSHFRPFLAKKAFTASGLDMAAGDSTGNAGGIDDLDQFGRRDAVKLLSTAVLALGLARVSPAFAAEGIGTSPDRPIVVVGAGGKCGTLCCQILARKGLYVRAVTRTGRSVLDSPSDYVTYATGDVTKLDTLIPVLASASGAIFTASASKKGGDAAHVDYLGVYVTAKACIANKVPKLVVISSGAVTRPTSIGFKITNVFGRIMDYKIAGETELRELYSRPEAAGLAYTIIRPGGLSDQPSKGAQGVEVSQGDILSAEIGREDVSEVTVAALLKGKATDRVTLEVYGSGGETLFGQKTGPAKLAKDLPDPTKFVHRSDTFEGLLDGLLNDNDLAATGVVSNYSGLNVEPVDSLI